MYQTVLFDLDGTLLDTIGDLTAAGNRVCAGRGWPQFTEAEFMTMVGNGIPNLVRRFSPESHRTPEELQKTRLEFEASYGAHCMERTHPYPGMAALLARLRGRGCTLGVVSNKADAFSRAIVEHYFPGVFSVVRGQLPGVPVKPDPSIVLAVMGALGAAPERTLLVGDSDVDIRTAHNASLAVCGVSWGFRSRESLVAAGADHLADDMAALERVILG